MRRGCSFPEIIPYCSHKFIKGYDTACEMLANSHNAFIFVHYTNTFDYCASVLFNI